MRRILSGRLTVRLLVVAALLATGLSITATFAGRAEATSGTRVYWANYGMGRIDAQAPDGTGAATGVVSTGVHQPRALDVDATHLYWINNGNIGRSDTDGSNQNPTFISIPSGATVFGLAVTTNYVYWTSQNGDIGRTDIDGTNSIVLVTGANLPYDIVATSSHLYWTEQWGTSIGIADLDGSNADHSFVTNAGTAYGIAADATHLYWGTWNNTGIGRVDLDGSNLNRSFIPGQCNVAGVAVDATHLYWANACDGSIRRANIDGTNIDTAWATGASDPAGLAIAQVNSVPATTTTSSSSSSSSTSSSSTSSTIPIPNPAPGNADRVFWANYSMGRIDAQAVDGTGFTAGVVSSGVSSPRALDVDATHLYWINSSKIGRSDLDGSNANPTFISIPSGATVFGLAITTNYVYWTSQNGDIGRTDIDGTNTVVLVTGASLPYDIVATTSHLYWTEQSGGTLGIADLDGSNANHSFVTNAGQAYGIAADATHVYWITYSSSSIGRVDLDGSNVNRSFIPGQCNGAGLAVDATHLYWANACDGSIRRADIDGTNIDIAWATGASDPAGVAVHIDPSIVTPPTTTPTTTPPTTTPPTTAPPTTAPPTTSIPGTTSTAPGGTAPTTTAPTITEDAILALPDRTTTQVPAQHQRGEHVTVSMPNFTPGEVVDLYVASTPIHLGSSIADANGVATVDGDLPTDLELGVHSLALVSRTNGTGYRQIVVLGTATSSTALPMTGHDPSRGVLYALLLLTCGAALSILAQRRRRV